MKSIIHRSVLALAAVALLAGTSAVNARARRKLGWCPAFDFAHVLRSLREGLDFRSALAREVGAKGYHDMPFDDGPYPVAR